MNLDDIFVRPEIEQASTLPSRFYKDRELYDLCIERLFGRSWQFIGDDSMAKVPGAVYPFTFLEGSLDEPVILTRDKADALHLVSNVCTHRGNIVCEGAGIENLLRCRYHGRRFHLDGRFHSMPEFEGVADFPSPKEDLAQIPTASWGPLLFASLNPSACFEDVIAPIKERIGWLPLNEFRLEQSRSKVYLVRGHWALYVDNYLEGFHVPYVHPTLNQAIDYESYTYELFDSGCLQLAHSKSGEEVFDLPKNSPDHGNPVGAYYYWLFPNTMLNFYPWGLSINVVKPHGPELSRVSFISYVWNESRLGQGAGGELDRVEREDEAIIELVQKGVKSRFYDRGRYSPKRELGTHHFHQLIARALRLS